MSRQQILDMLHRQAEQSTYGSSLLGGRASKGLRHCIDEKVGPSGRKRCVRYMPGAKMMGTSMGGNQHCIREVMEPSGLRRCARYAGPRSEKQMAAAALLAERARHLHQWLLEHPGMTKADYYAQVSGSALLGGRRRMLRGGVRGGCGCCGMMGHHEMHEPMRPEYFEDESYGSALLGGASLEAKMRAREKAAGFRDLVKQFKIDNEGREPTPQELVVIRRSAGYRPRSEVLAERRAAAMGRRASGKSSEGRLSLISQIKSSSGDGPFAPPFGKLFRGKCKLSDEQLAAYLEEMRRQSDSRVLQDSGFYGCS